MTVPPATEPPTTQTPTTQTSTNQTPAGRPTSHRASHRAARQTGSQSGPARPSSSAAVSSLASALGESAPAVAALRRMKLVAGGLLLVAAALFLISRIVGHGDGGWGYLQAMSEAAMVGGLADWFAVTALFRHPLGLPIPHTAIIPRKKDQIGESLGAFVRQNFLTEEVVGSHVAAVGIPHRAGAWLAEPVHAAQLTEEAALALAGAAAVLRDEDIRAAVAGFAEQRLAAIPAAPVLARVIDIVVEGGQHQAALTSGLRALMRFLDDNSDMLRQRVSEESPEWVPSWVDDRVFTRLFTGMQSFLADIASEEDHEFRQQFDERLRQYAHALRTDDATIKRIEETKRQILEHEAVRSWMGSLWFTLKSAALSAADDPDSELRRTATSVLVQVGVALRDDVELQSKVESWIQAALRHVLSRYSQDLAALISTTVARWDAAETSRRLEIQVGRDLQFIRVNGTIVGSLVGLVIYTVSQLL